MQLTSDLKSRLAQADQRVRTCERHWQKLDTAGRNRIRTKLQRLRKERLELIEMAMRYR